MTTMDAIRIINEYYENSNPDTEDMFAFTEALGLMIEQTKDPKYMTELAWHYCSTQRFDLEKKYLEMAAESGDTGAMVELGYMWYYGQHGEVDYEKAFVYFSKGAEAGDLWAKYKVADMYRFGLAVKPDEEEYRRRIQSAYEEVRTAKLLGDPYPEIVYRWADILTAEGDSDTATDLLKQAKRFMARRLSVEPFWGHIEVMERIVRRLYDHTSWDPDRLDLYDLFGRKGASGEYVFLWRGREHRLAITEPDGAVNLDGTWFRSYREFCEKAQIEGEKCTAIYDELYNWEVVA